MQPSERTVAPPRSAVEERAGNEASRRRVLARIALRVLLSALFVWIALRGIRIATVVNDLTGATSGWLVTALVVLAVSFAIGALRWRLLARGQGIELGREGVLRYTWIGLFFTNVLPTGFGGDAVRAWIAGRRAGALSRVTASVLIDRLVAVWALVAVGAVAVLFEFQRLPAVAIAGCLFSVAAVLAGSLILLLPAPARRLSAATSRWPHISGPVERVGEGLAHYAGRRDLLVRAFAISISAQACVVLAAYMLARALGLHLGVALLATCIPVALLATATPTNINGLGVRETVFRVLLVPAGVPAAKAVAFSLMTVIAAAIVSLPGAVAWIALRRSSQPAAAPAAHVEPARPPGRPVPTASVMVPPAPQTGPPARPVSLSSPRGGQASS
jgi:hypothetical protein